jgi:hypothetical protein
MAGEHPPSHWPSIPRTNVQSHTFVKKEPSVSVIVLSECIASWRENACTSAATKATGAGAMRRNMSKMRMADSTPSRMWTERTTPTDGPVSAKIEPMKR